MDYSSGYYVSWVRSERSQAEALIQEPFGSTSIIKTLRLYGADPKEYKIEYQGPRSTSTDVLDLREYTITGCTVFSLSPEQAQNYPGNYFQWLKDPETLQCGADDFYSVYLWRKDDVSQFSACTHTHTHTHTHAHTMSCAYIHKHAYTCTHTHARTHAYMHAHTHTYMHTCTHTHTHTHTHTLTCTHAPSRAHVHAVG